MNRNVGLALGIGCIFLLIVGVLIVAAVAVLPFSLWRSTPAGGVLPSRPVSSREIRPEPTYTVAPPAVVAVASTPAAHEGTPTQGEIQPLVSTADLLSGRFNQLNPGVVNIQVYISQDNGAQGQGAGSGFVLDTAGHIVTNHHVINGATLVIVVFYNGFEERAEVIGSDNDSDLAVLKVENLPAGVHPLPLADSNQVQVGDWAVAIGNPFGLGSSMTLGIVSALGRTIPSGVAQFSIPEAIQTDAAINPGNSGGPLFNLAGEVIGVNAQIRTGGSQVNSGVGFAIPTNVVRQVVPTLISAGAYQWPWLGVEGGNVNLAIAEANQLSTQQGAYIAGVVDGGPAAEAGLRGSSGVTTVDGIQVPTGGDIVTAVNGKPVASFNDLLAEVAFMLPGDTAELTILRGGETQNVNVTLAPRPDLDSAE